MSSLNGQYVAVGLPFPEEAPAGSFAARTSCCFEQRRFLQQMSIVFERSGYQTTGQQIRNLLRLGRLSLKPRNQRICSVNDVLMNREQRIGRARTSGWVGTAWVNRTGSSNCRRAIGPARPNGL